MVQAKLEKINKTGTMIPDILLNISCQNVILSTSLLHSKYEPTKIVKAKVNCLPNEMQVKDSVFIKGVRKVSSNLGLVISLCCLH